MIFISANYYTVEETNTHDQHNFCSKPKNYL
jgi:hypothetical protein